MQTRISNTLHNAIMEAGSKDRPPMLAPGNYVQWKSRIKRYIDTKPNHELIHYCLKNPPYKFTWADKQVPVFEGSPVTRTKTYMETYKNVSKDIRDQLNAKAKAVQIIITGIDNDIYSTVDACLNACEMWKAIERHVARECQKPKQVKDAAYHMEKMLLCKQKEAGIQLNAEQADWRDDTDDESEDQELEAHYMSMAQLQEVSPNAADSGPIFDTGPVQKLIEIVLFIVDFGCSKHMTRNPKLLINFVEKFMGTDKEIDKLMALISLSFNKIYKPTNNNLRTSSNTSRANHDNSLGISRGTGYDNQRKGNVAGARETVGTTVVQKSRIQCYNCKEFRHVARECQKPKRAKDGAYHKENMLLCMQEEAEFQLNAEQADWKDDTDDEPEDQELEAHYMYMAQIQ
nr:hypothetical protein [Tanacetum cinerariifolium]